MRYEPEKAIETLPRLLSQRDDRDRLLGLLGRILADPRVQRIEPTAQQRAMLERIRGVLGAGRSRIAAAPKTAAAPARANGNGAPRARKVVPIGALNASRLVSTLRQHGRGPLTSAVLRGEKRRFASECTQTAFDHACEASG